MKELNEYRAHLMEHLIETAKAFREACLAVNEPYSPLTEDGWTVHQIATHARDVNRLVYGLRARRTAAEDNPEFENFDGDKHIAEHYNSDISLNELLNEFVNDLESLTTFLQSLPVEAWSRESRHATFGGGFTLQTWVERGLVHIEEHLSAIPSSSNV